MSDTILAIDPPQGGASNEVCIYRVPQCLREGGREQNAYIPQVVSIGPYHYNRPKLRDMQGHKRRILNQMLNRYMQKEEIYLKAITDLEQSARVCYDKVIGFENTQFVKMMLLDGCFVIEFLRSFTTDGYSPSYPIFASRPMKYSISRDLIMLENQIPLFILNRIWELQKNEGDELMVHFQSFIEDVGMPSNEKQYQQRKQLLRQLNYSEGLHCLDLFRRCFVEETMPRSQMVQNIYATLSNNASSNVDECLYGCCGPCGLMGTFCEGVPCAAGVNSTYLSIPSVTKLKEVGMKFEKRQDLLWKIGYENGVLKLPVLRIDDITKYLFVNLIAFEQCYLRKKDDITSYLTFMDNLINTSEDVSQLTQCKIIENWLGSDDEVATLINTMGQGVMLSNYSNTLHSTCEAINEYYVEKWNLWCAILKRKYFDNQFRSGIYGIILIIVLTALQTGYTIGAYYQSKN